MNEPRYHFRGFPEFVEAAAERSGRPDLAGPVRRFDAIATMATLCAQAAEGEGSHSAAILLQAAEFRDQLRIASAAADAMLSAVARACGADRSFDGGSPPIDAPKRGRTHRRNAVPDDRTGDKS